MLLRPQQGERHRSPRFGPVVLDGVDPGATGLHPRVTQRAADGTPGQSWDVQTAGGGYYFLVNQATGLVLSLNLNGSAHEVTMASAGRLAQWAITPVILSRGD